MSGDRKEQMRALKRAAFWDAPCSCGHRRAAHEGMDGVGECENADEIGFSQGGCDCRAFRAAGEESGCVSARINWFPPELSQRADMRQFAEAPEGRGSVVDLSEITTVEHRALLHKLARINDIVDCCGAILDLLNDADRARVMLELIARWDVTPPGAPESVAQILARKGFVPKGDR